MTTTRPPLSACTSGAQLHRWYWTLAELTVMARALGVSLGGGKQTLTERLAAALDGEQAAPPPPPRAATGRQLSAPVGLDTVLPPGQRCSQVLRDFFRREAGPGFVFDAAMRSFIAEGAGRTLGDAVEHWHSTREAAARPAPIGAQFALNTFLRRRRGTHPGEGRDAALAAWREYRSRPLEERTAVSDENPSGDHDAPRLCG